LCEACGVTPEAFPPARPCHETLGEVTAEAAEATGLRKGTPVMVGTVDGAAAAMEAGAVEPGVAAEMTGTSTVLLIPNRDGIVEPALIAMPHAVPGVDLLLGATAASGANLNWFRDRFGAIESEAAKKLGLDVFDLLELEASGVPAGSGGVVFLPYMAGERAPVWHTNARGAFFGLSLETPGGA
jgi:xylulokinase